MAVILVVLYHAGVPGLSGGYVGVDVFFVISGYLITSHLSKSLRDTGTVQFGEFFARRARRILPAAFAVLAATIVATAVFGSPFTLARTLKDGIAAALYVPNLYFGFQQTNYLADAAPSVFQHYWSLGVEEQFYLLWPLLLWVIFRLAPRSPGRRAGAVFLLVAASFAACVLVASVSQPWAFFSLPTRAWELGAGALVALAPAVRAGLPGAVSTCAGWLGIAAIVWSAISLGPDSQYPGPTTLLPVFGAALFVAAGARPGRFGPARVLSVSPVQFVGRISYSLYLVHWPILILATARSDLPAALTTNLILAAIAVPIAWLLFRLVEDPLRHRAGESYQRPQRTLWSAAAISAGMAAALVLASPAVAALPTASDKIATTGAPQQSPSGTNYVPANMTPTLRTASDDTGALYTDGCQQTISKSELVVCRFGNTHSPFRIALFGDSHAGRWFPALQKVANLEHVRLDTYTKSACKSEDVDRRWPGPAGSTCTAWRQEAIAALNAHPPDLIVLINHLGLSDGRDASAETAEWKTGIQHSIDRLPQSSRVVTIADTPEFASSPGACLSTHLNDANSCAGPRDDLLDTAIRDAQVDVASRTGGVYIDLNDYFCSPTTCPPVIGSELVYADEHHLTATFTSSLSGPLRQALKPYLP